MDGHPRACDGSSWALTQFPKWFKRALKAVAEVAATVERRAGVLGHFAPSTSLKRRPPTVGGRPML